jgi:hypothetical protein
MAAVLPQFLWEENHVSSPGRGRIRIDEVIADTSFREWLATRTVLGDDDFDLLTGKNTGNFLELGVSTPISGRIRAVLSGTYERIPCAREQGIFGGRTGN